MKENNKLTEILQTEKQKKLQEIVRQFPDSPGIYIMRNENQQVLYVGKATSLRKRVGSYFYNQKKNLRIRELMTEVNTIDFISTESPYEALILECNFIKRLLPTFNRALKDSKGYQYLQFTNHPFPSLLKVMNMKDDGSIYYGPFTSSKKASFLHRLLLNTFHLRNCKKNLSRKNQKACLRYHMGQCPGVCIGNISEAEYQKRVHNAQQFLKNNFQSVKNELQKEMTLAAHEERFEYAAVLRDQIHSINTIKERQRVLTDPSFNGDVIAIYSFNQRAIIDLMKLRQGKIIYEDHFFYYQTYGEEPEGILQNFLVQYYVDLSYFAPPKNIYLNIPMEDADKISQLIQDRFSLTSFHINIPKIGKKKHLVDFCEENAKKHFENKFPEYTEKINPLLLEVQKEFNLPSIPFRIEGYDISHIQGEDTVGSMVVFINGKPAKKYYRYFKVKLESLPNDTGSLKEVIQRRVQHTDATFGRLPDLFLIDGGLGQLHAVSDVLEEENVLLPVLSLAKREELVYTQANNVPVQLNKETSKILQLFQQIRDESHRFAKKQFTHQHVKSMFKEKKEL